MHNMLNQLHHSTTITIILKNPKFPNINLTVFVRQSKRMKVKIARWKKWKNKKNGKLLSWRSVLEICCTSTTSYMPAVKGVSPSLSRSFMLAPAAINARVMDSNPRLAAICRADNPWICAVAFQWKTISVINNLNHAFLKDITQVCLVFKKTLPIFQENYLYITSIPIQKRGPGP